MAAKVKIDAPNQLPSSGLTPIKYKQWKIALKIFLHQTADFREYYPGGKYTTWTALEDNPHRILTLAQNDTVPQDSTDAEHLAQRRINLETFLGIIARYSDEGDFDEIMEKSTSLEWIHNLHERRYGIQKKGRHFNKIHEIRFDKTSMTDYNKFYNDLRACYKSNLRKTGDKLMFKGGAILTEDEKISPTTECLLIYMALERIDSRLPNEIDRIFGHRMDDNITLIDLQTEIFTYIPRALTSLDRDEQQAELNAQCLQKMNIQQNEDEYEADVDINAMFSRQPRSSNQSKSQQYNVQRNRMQYRNNNTSRQTSRFCRLCHALDMPASVTQTHNTENCRKKTLLQEITVLSSQYQDNEIEDEYTTQDD